MSLLGKIFKPSGQPALPGWKSCSLQEMQGTSDAIDLLYQKKLDGFLVKSFLSRSEVEQLRNNLHRWPTDTQIKLSFGRTYGKTLMGSDPDLRYYLDMAANFRKQLPEFADFSFEQKMLDFFRKVAGGRKVMVPGIGLRGKAIVRAIFENWNLEKGV